MDGRVFHIRCYQFKAVLNEGDRSELECVLQTGDLSIQGVQHAGYGKADFKREGGIGFREFRPDGRPGKKILAF